MIALMRDVIACETDQIRFLLQAEFHGMVNEIERDKVRRMKVGEMQNAQGCAILGL
jgi:hypothetical protein